MKLFKPKARYSDDGVLLSEEAQLFLLNEKLNEQRRKKRNAIIMGFAAPIITILIGWEVSAHVLHFSFVTDILVAIIGTMFILYAIYEYDMAHNQEKKIMQQMEEMAGIQSS